MAYGSLNVRISLKSHKTAKINLFNSHYCRLEDSSDCANFYKNNTKSGAKIQLPPKCKISKSVALLVVSSTCNSHETKWSVLSRNFESRQCTSHVNLSSYLPKSFAHITEISRTYLHFEMQLMEIFPKCLCNFQIN